MWKNFQVSLFCALQKASPLGAAASAMARAQYSSESTDLREVMAQKIPPMQEEVKAFRKSHGSTKVGEITVDMVSLLHSSAAPVLNPFQHHPFFLPLVYPLIPFFPVLHSLDYLLIMNNCGLAVSASVFCIPRCVFS